jgi:glycosyltransferase involved in cell wall biosynthesis
MGERIRNTHKKVLVVTRWPLGGIRTYMRYTFRYFPVEYRLTMLASSSHEDGALRSDAAEYGARLVIVKGQGLACLAGAVFRELAGHRYDVILSQGFISGVAVYLANMLFRRKHIMTIHGVVEQKLFEGGFRGVKRAVMARMLSGISVIYAVSQDMLSHLYEQFPHLKADQGRAVVIPNGIDMGEFEGPVMRSGSVVRKPAISPGTFLFGYFGRFMHEKGFDLLIDAVEIMSRHQEHPSFMVLSVGSGDYLLDFRRSIRERNLEGYFLFLPFQPHIREIFLEIDAVVMPSRWEASGLLAMETLAMGVPLIASDCIGLRETVAGTPADTFRSEDVNSLVQSMLRACEDCRAEAFRAFEPFARQRFDVKYTARQLVQVIESLETA